MDDSNSPETSRPGSRAQSDVSYATEVPDSPQVPRTIPDQIDHIKSMITRMQGSSRQSESITAQVFRRSGSSHEPVSQSRILHDLDSLKRRVRQQEQLLRRPSQMDPETDSETEGVIDEREEELEGLREELAHERAQREEWLDSAERRVDILASEKEGLSETLERRREDLAKVESEKDGLRNELEDVRKQLDALTAEKEKSSSTAGDTRDQLAQLQKAKSELAEKDKKIRGLEENNKIAGEHVQRLIAEHKTREEETDQRLKEVQERHRRADADATDAHGKVEELKKDVRDHEARRRELVEQVEEHKKLLKNAQNDVELHGKDISQLLKEHEEARATADAVAKERDELKVTQQRAVGGNDDHAREMETQLADLKADHESSAKSLADKHEFQQRQLQDELAEASRSQSNLSDRVAELEQEKEDLQEQLETKQKEYQEHVNVAETSMAEMEKRVLSAEHRAEEAETSFKGKETELNSEIASKDHDLAEIRGQLSELHQKLYDQSAELARKNAELSEASEGQKSAFVERQKLVSELDELRNVHTEEVARVRQEAAKTAEEARQGNSVALEEAHAAHDNAIDEMKRSAESRLENVRNGHAEEIEQLNSAHQAEVQELRAQMTGADREHDTAKQALQRELSDLKTNHERQVQELEAGWLSKADEASTLHQADLQRAADEAAQARNDLQKQLDERDVATDARLATAREDSASQVAKVEKELKEQLDAARAALETARSEIETERTQHESGVVQLRQEHESRVKEMQDSFDRVHEENQRTFKDQLTKAEEASTARSTEFESERDKTIQESETKHKGELDTLRQTHGEATAELQRRLSSLETRLENASSDHAQTLSEKEELTYKMSQLKSSHDKALAEIEEQHDASRMAARTTADDELEKALKAQSMSHSEQFDKLQESLNAELQNLQIQLEEAADLRHTQLEAAEEERNRALGDLGEKLKTTEQTASALEARLDAELTTRAEIERSLAEMRRQRFEEDKRSAEAKQALQEQVAALQTEKDALAKRLEAAPAPAPAKPNLQDNVSRSADHTEGSEDVSTLRIQLANAEKDHEEALKSIQEEKKEKSEIARQNEFLIKELQSAMTHRVALPQPPTRNRSDASVQTDAVSTADELPVSGSTDSKDQQRPVTPSHSQQKLASKSADRAWKTRSFEDYLHQAKAELSELGNVISQNEALFAQKINEHVGDLQHAKDQLAVEYKDKFDALLAEKDRMERDISARGAEEFAKERQQLVANYGANYDEPTEQASAISNLPSPKRRALRNEEEKLVSRYNQRIVKRKSQVAMKHAEEFQSLTQDYDRRVAELLSSREHLEGDLSVEPSKFEKDLDELDVMSAQLENEKANNVQSSPQEKKKSRELRVDTAQSTTGSNAERKSAPAAPRSQLPKRNLTSTPRTPTSIPKAVPFPGNRASGDFTSILKARQSTETQRSMSEHYVQTRPQSHIGPKSPPDRALPRRNFTSYSRGPERRSSQLVQSTAAQDFGVEPTEFERRAPYESMEKLSPEAPKTSWSKRRSMRHSSGIMYGGWQKDG